ncbi:MAG: tRNA uridine-5-carboxymethylaminomethyl(34) synthesis GTPase MnmE [Rubellimicrobium sp.]|nr:tRNA uridine-5-carboxymethylaminomethyl(34) synthesis GTPase MnmE [Rubellimicrobium sp.]
MNTIYALATAPGRAGVAVIRISGPKARMAAERMAGPLPESGRRLRRLRDAEGAILDEALVLTFAEGASFTGEAVVELHLHGGPAVIAAVESVLAMESGLRHAEAGEFTRRALGNGRLDLAQVEGLADLLAAETEAQRRQAMRVMSGDLGAVAARWRVDLVRSLALVEVTIDFVEEDIPDDIRDQVGGLIKGVIPEMQRLSAGTGMAERLRHGFEVAIVGAPNVGKSTLLNHLAGREAAITSAHAGTTRDVIEVRMDLAGLPVTLLDTAGIHDAEDPVELIGISRAKERATAADLRVHLVEPGEGPVMQVTEGDLILTARDDEGSRAGVSGVTGAGVDRLVEEVRQRLSQKAANAGLATRARHRDALLQAVGHLEAALDLLPRVAERAEEVAEELRLGIRSVDALVGRVDVEDVLDVIFSSFCIGK